MVSRFWLLSLLACAPLAAGELRVGAAAVRITPPPGAPMAGYYFHRTADGVHDDLQAKALVFEQDGVRAALVACDLISMPEELVAEARARIAKLGIPPERVMIGGTHAHTGPVLVGRNSREDRMPSEMLAIARQYIAQLPDRLAEAVERANAALTAARLSAGAGEERSISFNRRFWMKDGSVGWNPGKLNPNIVRPAGPIDPQVPVIYAESPQGKPLATYVNFAMHLDTVGGTEYSADYPFTLATLLGKVKSPEMLIVFTIGTAGNINHIDVSSREPQKGHSEAARIGTVLAGEVIKTYTRLKPVETRAPRGRRQMVKLPLPANGPGDLEKAREVAPKFGKPNAAPFLDLVKAFRVLDVEARDGKPLEAEVQVIALGPDLAFVGLPGEIFVELGTAIKKASPFRHTIVAELSNGSIGYVPDRAAYPQGAYEVVSARCAAGSGEMLVDAAVAMLKAAKQP
jgi:neutral ceramidase